MDLQQTKRPSDSDPSIDLIGGVWIPDYLCLSYIVNLSSGQSRAKIDNTRGTQVVKDQHKTEQKVLLRVILL